MALRKQRKLFAPAIVLTSKQSAGRGRGSNAWFSDRGSLTVTFVLPADDQFQPQQLPLVMGLAARNACAELTGRPEVVVKWPNDLLCDGKKLAGLLCQRIDKLDLVGIGINVNTQISRAPKSIRDRITSLAQIAGHPLELNQVLITLTRHIRQILRSRKQNTFGAFVEQYRQHDALAGRKISILAEHGEPPLRGTCAGIDASGQLLLRDGKKLHHIIAGHVLLDPL